MKISFKLNSKGLELDVKHQGNNQEVCKIHQCIYKQDRTLTITESKCGLHNTVSQLYFNSKNI